MGTLSILILAALLYVVLSIGGMLLVLQRTLYKSLAFRITAIVLTTVGILIAGIGLFYFIMFSGVVFERPAVVVPSVQVVP